MGEIFVLNKFPFALFFQFWRVSLIDGGFAEFPDCCATHPWISCQIRSVIVFAPLFCRFLTVSKLEV